ncbi:MAG TPA: CAP domain-containing protein [Thermoanaerobaculia bacterium]|nr:CAP domain-containing protein [Thermoanaerobaculia bacterium]
MKLLLALLLAVPLFASDATNEITADTVLAQMNAYRAEAGLAPLHIEARLSKAAEDRMRDMEDGGWWSHESPSGLSPFTWLTLRDYTFQAAAENVASGFETVRLLVASWMESRGHRENIMSPMYEDCGIAIIDGATTGRAMGKSVVVMFGKPVRRPESTSRPPATTAASRQSGS